MIPQPCFRFSPLFTSDEISNYRIPNILVTKRGTVLAFANDRRCDINDRSPEHWVVCRRREKGKDFEETKVIFGRKNWSCMLGAAFYDKEEDKILCLFGNRPGTEEALTKYQQETGHAPLNTLIAESTDDGKTFTVREIDVLPDENGFVGSTHGSAAGVQLEKGMHRGRLISAGRFNAPPPENTDFEALDHLQTGHWNCSVYSDDHGKTWHTGGRVQTGTGEGCLAELQSGEVMLNSRTYFYDGYRRAAWSQDGGTTFSRFQLANDLREIAGGVNASLIKAVLPDQSSILVYASVSNRKEQLETKDFTWQNPRRNVSVWVSFDDGQTWPLVKSVYKGPSAYNSLCFDEKQDRFFMMVEYGEEGETCYQRGIGLAEFNTAWLLDDRP